MNSKAETKSSGRRSRKPVRVALGTTQTIRDVARLRVELDELLAVATSVELDGGTLDRVDTAFLQLLTAFQRDAVARGIAVRWQATTPELVRVTQLLGLTQALALQEKA